MDTPISRQQVRPAFWILSVVVIGLIVIAVIMLRRPTTAGTPIAR